MNVWDARTNLPDLAGGAVVRVEPGEVKSLRPLEEASTLGRLALRCSTVPPSPSRPWCRDLVQIDANPAASVRLLLSEEDIRLIQEVSPL